MTDGNAARTVLQTPVQRDFYQRLHERSVIDTAGRDRDLCIHTVSCAEMDSALFNYCRASDLDN